MMSVPEIPICEDILSPGETFEHWCELPREHVGDHRCGDCGDVWNPSPDEAPRDEWPDHWFERHERWDGTCAECVEMRRELAPAGPPAFSSQAGLASLRAGR
jgi:hypothetical protein